ncbi:YobH family protein [Citrobacter amalonaticus]|uniref:YobH family protein n=1 Tax=Citrobacter amalonaticus TaxID=35703 RepID=UPI00300CC9D8
MRVIIRAVVLCALVWIGLLLSGYGVLIGSKENAAGLGLQCTYLTARGTATAQYVHTNSGIIGLTDCPILRKSTVVIDNG